VLSGAPTPKHPPVLCPLQTEAEATGLLNLLVGWLHGFVLQPAWSQTAEGPWQQKALCAVSPSLVESLE